MKLFFKSQILTKHKRHKLIQVHFTFG